MDKVTEDKILPHIVEQSSLLSVPIKSAYTFPTALKDSVKTMRTK